MSDTRKEQEKRFILETKSALTSKNNKQILVKLQDLKANGNVAVFPYIMDLLVDDTSEEITTEVLHMISDLKDQKCVPVIVEYIEKKKVGTYLADVVSSCWQSQLDFSAYLNSFAVCFVQGDYQIALESFTVIEEMLWKSSDKQIYSCKKVLADSEALITEEKIPLYHELLKVLDEGISKNPENYPDFYTH
jgi:hypothetical protein